MATCLTNIMAKEARFSYFTYEGKDPRFEKNIDPKNEYFNPIVAGYYPDPSVAKKGDTFYLVNSSFAYFPGIPIFESKDLVNWKQIGNVLNREEQLDLEGLGVSDGIFAPAISYNPHNDTFYMITTLVGKQGNFFVKSKDPSQGWSNPIWLPAIDGIDPSFLFDNDGKAYIVHNAPLNGPTTYDGERAIRLLHFDVENDTTVGEPIEIIRRGTSLRPNPIWIEGPHLYHIDDWYYLMCAEGGTEEDHSEVMFRSKSPEGPWEESPFNPILTQREGLPYDRPDKVTSTGHADMICDNDGNWWAVFLGCRPYEANLYNTGRETFLLPVRWEDGWPVILDKNTPVPTVVSKPGLAAGDGDSLTGNFSYTDRFEGDSFGPQWIFLRNPDMSNFMLTDNGLVIKPSSAKITERKPTSAAFRRQQHTNFTAETEMTFAPECSDDLAGMVLMQNENYNFVFGKTKVNGEDAVVLRRHFGDEVNEVTAPVSSDTVKLKIVGNGRLYSFFYMPEGTDTWIPLAENVDASNLSTHFARGFVGTEIGLYATSPQP